MHHPRPWYLAFGLTSVLCLVAACSKGGDTRTATSGNAGGSSSGTGDSQAEVNAASGGRNTDTVGGAESSKSQSLAGDATLEQCQAQKKAWRAVVNSGTSPSDCVETLVSWCCTRDEIGTRFFREKSKIEAKFADDIDADHFKLYACSTDGANRYTFHMAKIVGNVTTYRYVYVEATPSSSAASTSACQAVSTADLKSSSLRLHDDFGGDDEGDDEDKDEGESPPLMLE